MSANLAYARPLRNEPSRDADRQHVQQRGAARGRPTHIEIVTTRAQRNARPKLAYSVITIVSLFLIFAGQLLLSIVVSDGAYQLSGLQVQQKDLLRTEQALLEKLQILGSTQHLAANAAHLGMVPGSNPLYLDLSTGAVSSAPGTADPFGCGGGCSVVANSLLTGVPLVDAASAAAQTAALAAQAAAVAPASPQPGALHATAAQSVPIANPDVLPAPLTN